ncbi:hypothetical protein HZC30_01460 [Candidatus Woesearchaeota archaeon]|nr:hypothetical protein [Candidatus Woesearchaeota archaeon]
MSNRSSIKDAVTAVAKLDYTVLKEISANDNFVDEGADDEASEIEKLTSDDELVDYALLHQQPPVNYALNLDYLSELAGARSSSVTYEDDEKEKKVEDEPEPIITAQEAGEIIHQLQANRIFGGGKVVDYKKRESFLYYITFNPAIFRLQCVSSQFYTDDIDYSRFV